MAYKMKLLKMLQEVKGLAQVTNRRPVPRPPFLYLMQLRSQAANEESPRRRLAVETDSQDGGFAPLPIKINHITPQNPGLPGVID